MALMREVPLPPHAQTTVASTARGERKKAHGDGTLTLILLWPEKEEHDAKEAE